MNIHPLISFQLLLPERNTIETMQNDPPPPPPPPPLPLPQSPPDHQLWAVAAWQDCTNYAPWSPTLSSALSCCSLTGLYKLCPMITYPVISFELSQPDRTVQTMPHDHLPCHQLWVVAASCPAEISKRRQCRWAECWGRGTLPEAAYGTGCQGWFHLQTAWQTWGSPWWWAGFLACESTTIFHTIYLCVCVLFLHAADSHFCCTLNDECTYTHESKWPHQ